MNRKLFAEIVGGMLFASGQLRRDMNPTFVTLNIEENDTRYHELSPDEVERLPTAGKAAMQKYLEEDGADMAALVAHVGRLELDLADLSEEERDQVIAQLKAGVLDPKEVTQDAISILVQDARGTGELTAMLEDGQDDPPNIGVLGSEGWNYSDFGEDGWNTSLDLAFPPEGA